MAEKLIYLDGIEPVEFLGVNNAYFNILKNGFPKIKLIARGHEIKAIGEDTYIDEFEEKFNVLLDYFHTYNKLEEGIIEQIIKDSNIQIDHKIDTNSDIILYGNNGKPVRAKSINQRKLVVEYNSNDLLFAYGPAGSGKTYTAIALAVNALKNREVRKIILTRPAVEAGERLGFLPGDLKDKLDPYLQPLYDALNDMIPKKKLAEFMEDGTVEIAPLAYMRGRTLSNAAVILDEAQNTTVNQLKMFLTRMGENSKFIVTGDITQIDLPANTKSGLIMGMRILKNIKGISFIEFDNRDIVRHKLVKSIVDAYGKQNSNTKEKE